MKKLIHNDSNWPNHHWDDGKLEPALNRIKKRIAAWSAERLRHEENRIAQGSDNDVYLKLLFDNAVTTSQMEGSNVDKKCLFESFKKSFYESIRKTMKDGDMGHVGRDEHGLARMMLDSHLNCWDELDENRLCKWHRWLFPDRIDEHGQEIITGSWRTDEISVGLRYDPPDAGRITREMSRFLDWFNGDHHTDPLLKAGRAHLWFEQIHPFDNGNGRTGRAVMDMMLARAADFPADTVIFEIYHSMTLQLGSGIDYRKYYDGLARHNYADSNGDAFDITGWLAWFLECLERSMEHARQVTLKHDRNMQVYSHITGNEKIKLNTRQKRAVRKMLKFDWHGELMTAGKYMDLNGIEVSKRNTAARDLRNLVEQGVLIVDNPHAGRKSMAYRMISWDEIKGRFETDKERIRQNLAAGNWENRQKIKSAADRHDAEPMPWGMEYDDDYM